MKKIFTGIFVIISSVLIASGAISQTFAIPNENANETAHNNAQVKIPDHAREIAPGIFDIGTVVHDGKVLEGIMAFHHRSGHNGGPGGSDPGGPGDTSSCYTFIAKGAKWKQAENYIVDPSNMRGLDHTQIQNTIAENIADWKAAEQNVLMGSEISGTVDVPNIGVIVNDENEVAFAYIDDPGVIAVTFLWGQFSGPPQFRNISEVDQVYDDVKFDWSLSGESGKMDFKNISMHEDGHKFGLGHPSSECTLETMHASASNGETIKRNLNEGDITGIKRLY